MSHRVITVAGQIVGELGRYGLLARQADDGAAPQGPAFQRPRQRDPPHRPVPEQGHDADRPEQNDVAAREIATHPPAENARSQDQESSAPCAQHAAGLIVPDHQPVRAVELLDPHRGHEKNGDEDRRRDRAGIFAPKFVRHPMVDRLGASRTGENQRKVDAKRSRRDRPISDWQAPSASAVRSVRCSTQRARSPISARFESRSSSAALTIHRGSTPNGASVFARPRSSIDEFGNHSKLRVRRGSRSRTERSAAGRARPATARQLTRRTVSESQSKTSRPGMDRCVSRAPTSTRSEGSTSRALEGRAGYRSSGAPGEFASMEPHRTKRNDEQNLFVRATMSGQ